MASKAQEYVKAMSITRAIAPDWEEQARDGEICMRVYVSEENGRCMFDTEGDRDDKDNHFAMAPDQALALGRWLLETFTDATPSAPPQE